MNGDSREELEIDIERRSVLHRWILGFLAAVSLSVFVAFFLFERGSYLDCNLEAAPSISVNAEISFRVVSQYNSRNYSVDILSSDPQLVGSVSCYAGSVCAWLMNFKGWPKTARMELRECGLEDDLRQFYISNVEIEGRTRAFRDIYEAQIWGFKCTVAALLVSILTSVLALSKILRLVNRNQFGEGS